MTPTRDCGAADPRTLAADAAGGRTSTAYEGDGHSSVALYDADGKETQAVEGGRTTAYAYDDSAPGAGALTQVTYPDGVEIGNGVLKQLLGVQL